MADIIGCLIISMGDDWGRELIQYGQTDTWWGAVEEKDREREQEWDVENVEHVRAHV